jgi:5-methyltetrahydrofolate--homocysteine methyltransferase
MEDLKTAIKSGKAPKVVEQLDILLKAGHNARELLDIMIDSLRSVGAAFARGEAFIPEMLVAARAMQAGVEHIASELAASGSERIGKFMIGTVTGDMHDVGKNLVSLVLRGNGLWGRTP